jgi:D-alanyl-D-alanine carboxypeptidase
MNKKASELGMKDTHFMNVCGLHDSEHYTTAYDISVLLRYALSNEEFKEVFTSTSFDTSTDKRPSGVTLSSTLFSVMDSQEFRGGKIIGGKTGYTDEAGLCLASLAEIDGEEYMLVTMGAKGSHATEPFHIKDAVKIYETLANGGEPLPEEKTEPVEQSSSESSKKDSESSVTYDDTHITYDDTYSNIEDYYYSYEETEKSNDEVSEESNDEVSEEESSEEQSPESNSTSSEEEQPSPEQQPEAPEMAFDVQ